MAFGEINSFVFSTNLYGKPLAYFEKKMIREETAAIINPGGIVIGVSWEDRIFGDLNDEIRRYQSLSSPILQIFHSNFKRFPGLV